MLMRSRKRDRKLPQLLKDEYYVRKSRYFYKYRMHLLFFPSTIQYRGTQSYVLTPSLHTYFTANVGIFFLFHLLPL